MISHVFLRAISLFLAYYASQSRAVRKLESSMNLGQLKKLSYHGNNRFPKSPYHSVVSNQISSLIQTNKLISRPLESFTAREDPAGLPVNPKWILRVWRHAWPDELQGLRLSETKKAHAGWLIVSGCLAGILPMKVHLVGHKPSRKLSTHRSRVIRRPDN